jgi:hypothetical protein
MSLQQLLRHSLLIRRLESPEVIAGTPPTIVTDAWGHPSVLEDGVPVPPGYSDLATVAGLVQEKKAIEMQGPALQGTVITDTRIYLPVGTDVTTQDRIRNVANGFEYDVMVVRDAAGQGHHVEVDARRIDP